MPVNDNQRRFITELVAAPRRDQGAAYQRVYGGTRKSANEGASKLLADPEIRALVDLAEATHRRRSEITAEQVINDINDIKNTDVSELVEWRVGACRYCWGDGHLAQRTPSEWRRDYDLYCRTHRFADPHGLGFPIEGGVGYNANRKPHSDCPECFGDGVGRELLKDTRYISAAAKALYNGVKRTRGGGVEMLLRSKDKALDLAARHTGVSKENLNLGGKVDTGGVTIYVPDNGRDPPKEPKQ